MTLIAKPLRLLSTLAVLLVAPAALADHHAVKIAQKEGAGSYLTDAKGMALYVFKKDAPGRSACAGECVTRWPIYYREKITPASGAKDADFGAITREDGQKQTTYKGLPLYYFAGDKAPADTNGQGVREVWYLAQP